MKILYYILFLGVFISCEKAKKENEKTEINKQAFDLNNHGAKLILTQNNDSILKAIELFNEAIKIQPNYYLAYWNKFTFLNKLGKTETAFETLKQLEKLKPNNPSIKVVAGIFIEQNKDSLEARNKFLEADKIYNNILDTLKFKNDPNQSILTNKAVNLKLLGRESEGNEILKEISNKTTNENFKKNIDNFVTMSREDIIKNMKQY